MVEKMELETTDHPSPYRVSWLQKGHQVTVTKQCLVEFKIGGYKDKILCDVIPMDVCHLLLGRPWQYDRNVIHDGRMNTYTLDQNLDQGSKICSIFKVLGMRRKWYHCVRLVLLILAVYLLSQTESVWRSYRDLFAEPNRKKEDVDWAGRTADVAGCTFRTMMWQLSWKW
jgi:hypothetical protein